MKKRILILILLTIPSIVFAMDNKPSKKKEFPRYIEALDELTNKNTGCSEDLTDRNAKHTREKDQEIQKK